MPDLGLSGLAPLIEEVNWASGGSAICQRKDGGREGGSGAWNLSEFSSLSAVLSRVLLGLGLWWKRNFFLGKVLF